MNGCTYLCSPRLSVMLKKSTGPRPVEDCLAPPVFVLFLCPVVRSTVTFYKSLTTFSALQSMHDIVLSSSQHLVVFQTNSPLGCIQFASHCTVYNRLALSLAVFYDQKKRLNYVIFWHLVTIGICCTKLFFITPLLRLYRVVTITGKQIICTFCFCFFFSFGFLYFVFLCFGIILCSTRQI